MNGSINENAAMTTPIIVDLGKQSRKRIRQLKDGEGRLMDEVDEVIAQVQAQLGDEVAGKVIMPVIIVYEKKEPRNTGLFGL